MHEPVLSPTLILLAAQGLTLDDCTQNAYFGAVLNPTTTPVMWEVRHLDMLDSATPQAFLDGLRTCQTPTTAMPICIAHQTCKAAWP